MAAPVVLITGAAHRLGAHTAETLHGRGWNVVIHYRSRQEQARQLIDKLNRERADSATSVQADLTNPEDLARLAKTAGDHRSEEHTSELQSRPHLVCRLLLEKKKQI